jgi:hypothetical protein
MKIRLALGLCLVLPAGLAAPLAGAAAEERTIADRSVFKAEIERILGVDDIDTSRVSAPEVAEIIASTPQGGAPDDFWNAYQAHVRAWQRLAELADAADPGEDAQIAAEDAIGSTFAEVERIAGKYGAARPNSGRADGAVSTKSPSPN